MHKKVLVCVTQQRTCESLIRQGSMLSRDDEDSNLYVIHVVNEKDKLLYNLSDGDALEYLFEITKEVGANLVVKRSKDVIKTIVDYAIENEITHVVLGTPNVQDPANNFASKLKRKLPGREFII
ncbi:universal stress protein [Sedimentibacter sp. MB31-C6]|uniref:universal stress protein n=1 Tax=Sedimentibacter sp. MB31-C6 TaxID=3109366 RepID=UPI002DDD42EB|nr:universal stress protein [Sedimentibacter sp. MB36-C1]WSI04400.1 universal stress protein [Sedimentibacter sp. MB36-C1]